MDEELFNEKALLIEMDRFFKELRTKYKNDVAFLLALTTYGENISINISRMSCVILQNLNVLKKVQLQ